LKNILSHELREQAGSNSFNRFDYQVHWIVYHMLNEYKKNSQFLIFCEYHDDMAKVIGTGDSTCAEFFQIKTTEKYSEWTLSRLTNTTKKRSGDLKHSFLGFLFYNFMKFDNDCSKCHFVSNKGMDKTILKWQAIIEDGKIIKDEDVTVYNEIRLNIRNEYLVMLNEDFDKVFDRFIQNTFVYDGELTLENYEKVVAGEFFIMLENADLYTSNSNKILKDIVEDVRRKSKAKINVPISIVKLREKKGVSSDIFLAIKNGIKNVSSQTQYDNFKNFLTEINISTQKRNFLVRTVKKHHQNLLDIQKTLYQDSTYQIMKIIDDTIEANYSNIDNIGFLLSKVISNCEFMINEHTDFLNNALVEVMFYERILSEDATV
jgi:hypothetical protein